MKWTEKQTLTENYEEAIAIEKDLHATRVISDDELAKYSKDIGKRSQASVSKAKEKEESDVESLTRLLKSLTTKVVELKQWTSETTVSSMPPRYPPKKNVASGSSQPAKSA